MAYDASNNKDDQSNVMGSTPLSQGSTPIAQDQSQGDSAPTPSAPSSGASSTGMSSQGSSTSKAAPKSSSGMFTNIQNYVKKNQPQAQKMSQAVQADTGSQASEIRQAAEKKQAQTASIIGTNNQAIQAEKDFATQTVGNIMNTPEPVAPLSPTPAATAQQTDATATTAEPSPVVPEAPVAAPVTSEDDMARFQAAMAGNVTGVQDVANTNFSSETNKAQALRGLAQNATSEQGRKNLLRGTFGDRDQGYSRGMAGLDQLILGGDEAARTDLIQGIQGQSEGLQTDIKGLQQQELESLGAQRQALKNIGADITGIGTGAETGLTDQFTSDYDAALAERTALLNPESAEYMAATQGSQAELDRLGGILGDRSKYASFLEGGMGNMSRDNKTTGFDKYFNSMKEFEKTGKIVIPGTTSGSAGMGNRRVTPTRVLEGDAAKDYLNNFAGSRVTHHKNRQAVDKMAAFANAGIMGGADQQDLYGLKGIDRGLTTENNQVYRDRLGGSFDKFNKQLTGLGTADDIVQNRLAREGGIDYNRLAAGEDIGKYDTASDTNINKVNALRSLMGKSNQITDEQRGDKKFTSADSLRNLLAKYGS